MREVWEETKNNVINSGAEAGAVSIALGIDIALAVCLVDDWRAMRDALTAIREAREEHERMFADPMDEYADALNALHNDEQ